MHNQFLRAGVIAGGLAVALGAFGAHGLERLTSDLKILDIFKTGTAYQMYHAFALIAAAIIYEKFPNRSIKWAGYFFIWGIILFSGSLYLLTLLKTQESTATNYVGILTPIGGLLFIAGWLSLLMGILRKNP